MITKLSKLLFVLMSAGLLLSASSASAEEARCPDEEVKPIFYSDHPAAFHTLTLINYNSGKLEFEDGSSYHVNALEMNKIYTWHPGDIATITQNTDPLAVHKYRIYNLDTNTNIPVHMKSGPYIHGAYTYYITGIDYLFDLVYLNDGSVFDVSTLDSGVMSKWLPNDTIVIGCNYAWNKLSNPNILINVNMDNYVRASRGSG